MLSVEDSGPGLADADRSRLGDRFFRVSGTAESGSGLGWSIVQRIVDLHAAAVNVRRSGALGASKSRSNGTRSAFDLKRRGACARVAPASGDPHPDAGVRLGQATEPLRLDDAARLLDAQLVVTGTHRTRDMACWIPRGVARAGRAYHEPFHVASGERGLIHLARRFVFNVLPQARETIHLLVRNAGARLHQVHTVDAGTRSGQRHRDPEAARSPSFAGATG